MAKGRVKSAAKLSDRLGYTISDAALLRQALTHGSSGKRSADYERLEFLGDRVLSLVIAEALYHKHHTEKEGKLAARHSAMVRGDVCAAIAERLGLAEFLLVGDVEKKTGVHKIRSVLGDALEALIGAIYVDGGLEAARGVVLRLWESNLAHPDTAKKDAKTFVQEWVLARALPLPRYDVVSREGPEHKPKFTVQLVIDRHDSVQGVGATKQAAEMAAAAIFISREGLR